jgi:hypothetical protein
MGVAKMQTTLDRIKTSKWGHRTQITVALSDAFSHPYTQIRTDIFHNHGLFRPALAYLTSVTLPRLRQVRDCDQHN